MYSGSWREIRKNKQGVNTPTEQQPMLRSAQKQSVTSSPTPTDPRPLDSLHCQLYADVLRGHVIYQNGVYQNGSPMFLPPSPQLHPPAPASWCNVLGAECPTPAVAPNVQQSQNGPSSPEGSPVSGPVTSSFIEAEVVSGHVQIAWGSGGGLGRSGSSLEGS